MTVITAVNKYRRNTPLGQSDSKDSCATIISSVPCSCNALSSLRSLITIILFVQDTVSPQICVNRWLHLALLTGLIDSFPLRMLELLFPSDSATSDWPRCGTFPAQYVYLEKNY